MKKKFQSKFRMKKMSLFWNCSMLDEILKPVKRATSAYENIALSAMASVVFFDLVRKNVKTYVCTVPVVFR